MEYVQHVMEFPIGIASYDFKSTVWHESIELFYL